MDFVCPIKVKMKLLKIKNYTGGRASSKGEKNTGRGRLGAILVAAILLLAMFALSGYDMRTRLLEAYVADCQEPSE